MNHLNDTKLEQIKLALLENDYSETHLDVLVINETFWDSTTLSECFKIPGYNLFRRDRTNRRAASGIAIYVNSALNHVKRRTDLEDNDIEVLWLELFPFKSNRKLILGGVYRPSNSKKETDNKLGMRFENVALLNVETVILGDFNVDYFDTNYHSHLLMKVLKSLLFSQLLKFASRPTSGKCPNHIWTHKPNFSHEASTRDIYISDHLPIQCVL